MSNLPAPCATHKSNLTNRKRRKVVVEHEAFFGFAFETFEALHIIAGTERCGDQGLGFAAGEDGAPVGAGDNSRFDPDGADFLEGAPTGPSFLFSYLFAE